MRSKAVLLTCWWLSACVTTAPAPSPAVAFAGFPAAFKAIQVVTVHHGGATDQVLANLSRQGEVYDVTFLQPALQLPLVEITSANGRTEVHKFQEALPAGFPGEQIMASLRSIYPARDFASDGAAKVFVDPVFTYRLEDFGSFSGCVFPRLMTMTPRSAVAAAAVSLTVETKELACG